MIEAKGARRTAHGRRQENEKQNIRRPDKLGGVAGVWL